MTKLCYVSWRVCWWHLGSSSVLLLIFSVSLFSQGSFIWAPMWPSYLSLGEWAAWASWTTTKSDIFTPSLLLCCELCYMHDRKSVFTFLFSTHVYKIPATEFMYRFCTGCPHVIFSALVNKKKKANLSLCGKCYIVTANPKLFDLKMTFPALTGFNTWAESEIHMSRRPWHQCETVR